ncbi:MAG: hypothetical protein CMQ75_05135 [Gammaproteobacteria bacterium]|nr:hypothetical protein [Gammaproteobacteria bacterium]
MKVSVIHAAFGDTPHVVAFVDVPDGTDDTKAMDYAYRWTNNVMGSWSRKEKFFEDGSENGDYNENVTVMAPLHEGGMGLRSTSMGDQMLVGTKKYEVAMFGFEEIA